MKTIQTTVFEYKELGEAAQAKARDWYREGALQDEWWESIYEDAAHIGLEIKSFDLDRNRHATGRFTISEQQVARRILLEHGATCETFKTATQFLADVEKQGETTDENQAEWDELCEQFLKSILEDYSIMLQHEMEYLTSDEAVIESILANEYTFTETGKRYG